jgi:hypothetical protein
MARKGQTAADKFVQRVGVRRLPLALVFHRAIPAEAEALQGAQDLIGAAALDARGVEVFDAQQPAAVVMARVKITAERGD